MEADTDLYGIFPEKPQTRLPTKKVILQMQSRSPKCIMPSTSLSFAISILELNHEDISLTSEHVLSGYKQRASLDLFFRQIRSPRILKPLSELGFKFR